MRERELQVYLDQVWPRRASDVLVAQILVIALVEHELGELTPARAGAKCAEEPNHVLVASVVLHDPEGLIQQVLVIRRR